MEITLEMPNTTMFEFLSTFSLDPDETAHNKQFHLDLQCLPSSLLFFMIHVIPFVDYFLFLKILQTNFVVCFFCALRVKSFPDSSENQTCCYFLIL